MIAVPLCDFVLFAVRHGVGQTLSIKEVDDGIWLVSSIH
jgi:hypothetical protein